MGNLGEELEELGEKQDEPEETPDTTEPPSENFAALPGLKQIVEQQEDEQLQLKLRYLDALGRKMSRQQGAVRQNGQARQVIQGSSRAARRMFKRKSGKD